MSDMHMRMPCAWREQRERDAQMRTSRDAMMSARGTNALLINSNMHVLCTCCVHEMNCHGNVAVSVRNVVARAWRPLLQR